MQMLSRLARGVSLEFLMLPINEKANKKVNTNRVGQYYDIIVYRDIKVSR